MLPAKEDILFTVMRLPTIPHETDASTARSSAFCMKVYPSISATVALPFTHDPVGNTMGYQFEGAAVCPGDSGLVYSSAVA